MGRKAIDVEPYRELILDLHHQRIKYDGILEHLATHRHFSISKNVLEKSLRAWGATRNETSKCRDEDLRKSLIAALFMKQVANDKEILIDLKSQDLATTPRKLRRLRLQMGLRRRREDRDGRGQDEDIMSVLKEHLSEGVIVDWGLSHLYAYFRRNGIIISRDDIMYGLRLVDPEGVDRRYKRKQHRRKRFLIDGPNAIWSVDAHCKLEIVGIQIYAVIDAYSRKIIWIYAGVSGRSAVSCVKQFLSYLQQYGIMPERIRSDRGVETILIADAFHQLCLAQEDRPEEKRAIEKCWIFGTSTKNQRIEAWWRQLQSSMLQLWVVFFHKLVKEDHYNKDKQADRIAVFAIYMPFIREACREFVTNWNVHNIRTQKKRPNTTAGKPWFLYKHPQEPAVDCSHVPDAALVDALAREVEVYDLDEYLPATTLQWCHEMTLSLGFDLDTLTAKDILDEGTGRRAHGEAYKRLKGAVERHLAAGNINPTLSETHAPKGARSWKPSVEAVEAFNNARREEEPEQFREQLDDLVYFDNEEDYASDGFVPPDDGEDQEDDED